MKKTIIVLSLMVMGIVLLAGPGHYSDKVGIKHYIAVQEALAADNYESAKESLALLVKSSEGEIKKLAEAAYKAKNLDALRLEFKPLSEKLARIILPSGLAVAYCPMAKAHWVQKNGDVTNPYYGSAMLRCGTIKKVAGDHKAPNY